MRDRLRVLVGTTLLVVAMAAVVLSAVIWTVVLAIAASYVLLPLYRWFRRRGIPSYWSAISAALVSVIVSLITFLPVGFVLYVRRGELRSAVNALDGEITLFVVSDRPVVLDVGAVQAGLVPEPSSIAVSTAEQLATLSAKFTVFAFVVFGILYYNDRLRSLVYRTAPPEYYDVVETTHSRVRGLLFGHYLLALLGAWVTFLFGLVVFTVTGFPFPYTMALASALFWILPVVNVGFFVLALTASVAVTTGAVTAFVFGLIAAVVLVAIPRIVVFVAHHRLGRPQRLSQPVYFVGFVGGWLTLGPVGIVVGPLALVVMLALQDLLAADNLSSFE